MSLDTDFFVERMGCRQVGKAQGFDPCIRRFESCHPSHTLIVV